MRPGLAIFLATAACVAAAACAAVPATSVTCLPMRAYTPAQEAAIGDALAQLAPGNPLLGAMDDYAKLRAANAACGASKP